MGNTVNNVEQGVRLEEGLVKAMIEKRGLKDFEQAWASTLNTVAHIPILPQNCYDVFCRWIQRRHDKLLFRQSQVQTKAKRNAWPGVPPEPVFATDGTTVLH